MVTVRESNKITQVQQGYVAAPLKLGANSQPVIQG